MVQYVLELGHAEACSAVVRSLGGKFSELSMQKFSSNVVERCLKLGGLVSFGRQGAGRDFEQAFTQALKPSTGCKVPYHDFYSAVSASRQVVSRAHYHPEVL